jgi:amino acid adenylation domain-containing protein
MTTAEFLSSLRTQDIQLWAEGQELCYSAAAGALTSELAGELKKRKAEIMRLLQDVSDIAPPVLPVSRDCNLPVSFAQERLWFLDQLEPANPSYNIPAAFLLAGCLDLSALEQALNEVLKRHEALRTTFAAVDGRPFQVIAPITEWTLPIVEIPPLPESERENEIQRLVDEEARRPFDLGRGPLFRACVARLDDQQHVLLVTMHHIVSDGWSMGVFFEELSMLYGAFSACQVSPLPKPAVHYADFAVWQRRRLQGEVLESQLSYWKHHLGGALPVLELPRDNPRPVAQASRGARVSGDLPSSLSYALKDLSHRESVSLFMTLLAAFKLLLHRYTGEEDLLVGSPIAGRNRAETEKLIGFFLNTLVLRSDLSGDPSFRELLARVRDVALDAFAHQDIPFEKLLQELQPDRDLGRTPLFQVFFNMLTLEGQDLRLQDLTATRVDHSEPYSKFDLTVYVSERGERIHLDFVYNAELFGGARMRQMLEHFQTLLQGIVADPDQRLSDLPLLTDDLRRQLRACHNSVRSTEPFVEFEKETIEQSIADRFDAQVKKYPDHVAVKTRSYQWTYSQLNRTANQIAQTILRACPPGEQRIGLLFEHDAPMIAGILAMLKAGKTYVPLDPSFPAERLAYFLEDSQSTVVLTNRRNIAVAEGLTNRGLQLINADEIDAEVSTDNPDLCISPDTLAYILYTSGSTGLPKGVVQNHRNVLHHIRTYTNSLHLNSDDKLTLFSSYGFDAAVMDIFGALLNGASLHPLDVKQENPPTLFRRVTEEKITVYHSTPSVYRYLTNALTGREDLAKIRLVVLGGEEVHREDIDWFKKIFSPQAIFVNGLGPSESTMALQFFINHDTEITCNSVPVGYPVEDTEVFLLNKTGKPGEVFGEIGIRSAHMALGYWRRPEMTQEAFLPDPHGSGKRIYRTGDLGRQFPDGSIAFAGRKDFQVKIRGVRIELGEIESVLVQHPAVLGAVAVVREDEAKDRRLVAYVVLEEKHPAAVTELREFLKKKLPGYMIPSAIMALDTFPLTANGKVDRQALPFLDQSDASFVAPRTSVEEVLAAIWAEILTLERVGIHDNFFDLGGHSLLTTQLVSRVQDAFRLNLPVRTVFENPTIERLASMIQTVKAGGSDSPVPPVVTPLSRQLYSVTQSE